MKKQHGNRKNTDIKGSNAATPRRNFIQKTRRKTAFRRVFVKFAMKGGNDRRSHPARRTCVPRVGLAFLASACVPRIGLRPLRRLAFPRRFASSASACVPRIGLRSPRRVTSRVRPAFSPAYGAGRKAGKRENRTRSSPRRAPRHTEARPRSTQESPPTKSCPSSS